VNDDELTQYIIDRLGEGVGRSDVIHEVCERSSKSWPQAEAFVDQVSTADREQIAGRTFPLLALVSVVTVIAGGALIVLLVGDFLQSTHLAGNSRSKFEVVAVVGWLAQNASVLPMAGMGLAMVLGGLIGLVRAAQDL
jgi:hypothetical protein